MKRRMRCLIVAAWMCLPGLRAGAMRQDAEVRQLYRNARPPDYPAAVLQTVKLVVGEALFTRDDFYREEHLKQLFGDKQIVRIIREMPGRTGTDASVFPFRNLMPAGLHPKPDGGVFFDAYKDDLPGKLSYLGLMVEGISEGFDFRAVTGIFGKDWIEDIADEQNCLKVLNPPRPPATGYMGYAVIEYRRPETTIQMNFAGDGTLEFLQIWSERLPPMSCNPPGASADMPIP
jgi:hypothetical protein